MSETVVPSCVAEWGEAVNGCRLADGGARWVGKTRWVQQVGRGVCVKHGVWWAGTCTASASLVTGRGSLVGNASVLVALKCCVVRGSLARWVQGDPKRVEVAVGVVSEEVG